MNIAANLKAIEQIKSDILGEIKCTPKSVTDNPSEIGPLSGAFFFWDSRSV